MKCPKCGSGNALTSTTYQFINECLQCGHYWQYWQQERISELEAENAKLREEIESLYSADVQTQEMVKIITEENDKLREGLDKKILEQLQSYKDYGFLGNVDDPIYMEALRILTMGFDEAHLLRDCGHSIGDNRDPSFGTSDYAGNEVCIGCAKEDALKIEIAKLRSDNEGLIEDLKTATDAGLNVAKDNDRLRKGLKAMKDDLPWPIIVGTALYRVETHIGALLKGGEHASND